MNEKIILGLDLGPNSIGWAVVKALIGDNNQDILTEISSAGVRIIPMDAATLGDFERGNTTSQTKDRTQYRITRRMIERCKLRRDRLHRILYIMGFLPSHYADKLNRYGQFANGEEVKLPWTIDEQSHPKFIFEESFNEMLRDFAVSQPTLVADGRKVPYDWTIYYLRKKALTQPITKHELAWILLNFNQKRGYNQLFGEDHEEKRPTTRQYFTRQAVTSITDTGQKYKGMMVLKMTLADGTRGKYFSRQMPDWGSQERDIIVKVDIDRDGNDKHDDDGELICRFSVPTEQQWEENWKLVKARTENDLTASGKTVGAFIYDNLLSNPSQKIRGKLVRTVDRKYYKDELKLILQKQQEYHPELSDSNLYEACLNELYPMNEPHRNSIAQRDMAYLLTDDLLFYQRPLKSKKSLIANCPFESHVGADPKTGEPKNYGVKCIAKSNPLFQEFRLWQFIENLRILEKQKVENDKTVFNVDVTSSFLPDEDARVALFDWLIQRQSVKESELLKYPAFHLKRDQIGKYQWNYSSAPDKAYPCGETHALLLKWLGKAGVDASFLTPEREFALWHILYSVSFKEEMRSALGKFAAKHGLDSTFVETFLDMPPFKKEYGSYSAKAIKKLLPLMRMGKYWNSEAIDKSTLSRIDKIITGEYDENIKTKVREKAIGLNSLEAFRGLPLWLACYVVYNRHAESGNAHKWNKPEDIDGFLKEFKQHSLHNPIVEQVIMETMRTVRDIWRQVGHIDEIHLEMGREMKKTKSERATLSKIIQENENTNLRIKALLQELANPVYNIENVRPYSPSQQELLKIYVDYANSNATQEAKDQEALNIYGRLSETNASKRPTSSEIMRYKLWLEQKYRSPYTGCIIPLAKLFTSAYEIEHIIPRSVYFDDSLSNKVICEADVNSEKGPMLAHQFIIEKGGMEIGGRRVLSKDEYEKLVDETYSSAKRRKLLMDEIPDDFIARQLNDSRYISKYVKSLLSNIVRRDGEDADMSTNVIVCTGAVTDRLKKDWGVNDAWNRIILPRFQRLNELTGTTLFTSTNTSGHQIPAMPLSLQKGFRIKRIDHRHHAMDAIVIACASRNIVNYLNNECATKDAKLSRYDLRNMLCTKTKTDSNGNYQWVINKPWPNFTQDVYDVLQGIVVSFKQNLRVITTTSNHYQHYVNGEKKTWEQEPANHWAIRKPLHKETVYGLVNLRSIITVGLKDAMTHPTAIANRDLKKKLRELMAQGLNEAQIKKYFAANSDAWQDVNLKKIEVYQFSNDTKDRNYASRFGNDLVSLLSGCSRDKAIKTIGSITDTGIQKILLRHLEACGNNPAEAFSPEGVERMNANMPSLNNGKAHCPIYKVRVYETANKFAVGTKGNKKAKFVEAAKGTNLYLAIYKDESKASGRTYFGIPLRMAIERLKQGFEPAPSELEGKPLMFVLSPNDFVYLPTSEEKANGIISQPLDKTRIYKFVDGSDKKANFIPYCSANVILSLHKDEARAICQKDEIIQNEYGLGSPQSKNERALTGEMIKETCIPLRVDRLGNITLRQ